MSEKTITIYTDGINIIKYEIKTKNGYSVVNLTPSDNFTSILVNIITSLGGTLTIKSNVVEEPEPEQTHMDDGSKWIPFLAVEHTVSPVPFPSAQIYYTLRKDVDRQQFKYRCAKANELNWTTNDILKRDQIVNWRYA